MLATNLPVYFTSSSLCHRVALITNSMPLRSVTLSAIGAVDLVLWLFATSSSGSVMYHPSLKGLSCSSRNIFHPYHPNHARKVTSMLTIFHRYSKKSTFTIFFSARVADLHLFKASFLVFGCFLRQIHLLLSFPPQAQDIIFFSQTSDYFLYEDSCKLCHRSYHGHSKSTFFTFFSARMAVLHIIFTASLRFEIFPSVHHTSYCIFHHEDHFSQPQPTELYIHLENALT